MALRMAHYRRTPEHVRRARWLKKAKGLHVLLPKEKEQQEAAQ